MEPTDLNPAPADDTQFDAWLQRHATLAPLRDDGFSTRVIHALPRPAIDPLLLEQAEHEQRTEARRRGLFCAVGALAGLIVAVIGLDLGAGLTALWHSLGHLPIGPFEIVSGLGLASLTLGSLALVYWEQLKALRRDHA